MKRIVLYGTVLALIHLVINILHGQAHTELHIGLSSFQLLFVVGVIFISPLLAMVLLWTQRQRLGLVLLTASMAGACLFGLYYHFVVPSPDHVAHVPEGFWGDIFRVTAVLLAIVEGTGVALGWLWLRAYARVLLTPHPASVH
jgi:hypothetical protein